MSPPRHLGRRGVDEGFQPIVVEETLGGASPTRLRPVRGTMCQGASRGNTLSRAAVRVVGTAARTDRLADHWSLRHPRSLGERQITRSKPHSFAVKPRLTDRSSVKYCGKTSQSACRAPLKLVESGPSYPGPCFVSAYPYDHMRVMNALVLSCASTRLM